MSPNYERAGAFGPFLQGLVFAIIASGGLFIIAAIAGDRVNDDYVVIAAMAFVLSLVAFRRFDMLRHWELGRVGSIGTRVYVSWIFVAALPC